MLIGNNAPPRAFMKSLVSYGLVVYVCFLTSCTGGQPPASRTHGSAPAQTTAGTPGETLWLQANGLLLKTKIYRSARLSEHPTLIVVLHGDSPFAPPSYQYAFARQAAGKIDNLVVAALLRPGYKDDAGDQSQGIRGKTTGDNYTPETVDAVAQVIDQLKARFNPAGTILAGHSGGAAITGNVLGRWPAEIDGALMVSCPCDLVAWRRHMLRMQWNPIWLMPVKSLSPVDLADHVRPGVVVRMLVGSEDPLAPPELTQEYAAALRKHGDNVTVTVAPGLKHDILLEPVAFDALRNLVEAVSKPAPKAL